MPDWNMQAMGDAAALAAGCGLVFWIAWILRIATQNLWPQAHQKSKKTRFSLEDEFYLRSIHVRL